jgi:sigma-B regulation protein RsbU (phosphoserine phosphatase)
MADSIQLLLLDTARKERLEGEIAVARTIQQKLLPLAAAELAGVTVLAHVQSVAEIGGDYYDYLPTPDGRVAIAIGDVSGHGLPTGLLVAMAKAALVTLIDTGLAGSAIFSRLNDLIHRSTDSRSYMTLALFLYDPASRRVELTNAGQLAPYRLSPAGIESRSLPSFPLGVSERTEFPTDAWQLAAGDRIVFLTDGLVECRNPAGDLFGFERLERILEREAGGDAAALKDAILREIETHTGGAPPEDDRTLVIVTLEGSGLHLPLRVAKGQDHCDGLDSQAISEDLTPRDSYRQRPSIQYQPSQPWKPPIQTWRGEGATGRTSTTRTRGGPTRT